MIRAIALVAAVWPVAASALTLDFPGNAALQSDTVTEYDSYAMPTGPWADGAIPTMTAEGEVTRQAWKIEAPGLGTLQLVEPLREQLRSAGFDILYECQTEACGGFDFRFGTEVIGPPEMQIDLGDFRYLSAQRGGEGGAEVVSLLVSRTESAGFVQLTRVGPPTNDTPVATAQAPAVRTIPLAETLGDFATMLDTQGHVALSDLTFDSGSAQLGQGSFASLRQLADYLAEFPNRTVALVGHTDSSGSLEANIALSKRRAGSVLERLVSDYGVNRRQLDAQGMGYLAPVASNLTEAGREANRRVEVIVTSTE
jgi:OOP family OmpA-OmpF porin